MKENFSSPDWSESHLWNEYEWELMMRRSDDFAAEYFTMLKRYSDLPGADELIMDKMELTSPVPFEEEHFEYEINTEMESFDDLPSLENLGEAVSGFTFYETAPSYSLLRQVSLGWCNIYATFLEKQHRMEGMHVLFYLGRALAHLGGSLGAAGDEEQSASSIASCKRALDQVNKALGIIEKIGEYKPVYKNVTDVLRQHLREIQDKMIDHLMSVRGTAVQK
mgnify:CR=1 FL=1